MRRALPGRSALALGVAALLAACATPLPTKHNWQWVGGGDEPGEAKLVEQHEVCEGVSDDPSAVEGCMAEAGWVLRR